MCNVVLVGPDACSPGVGTGSWEFEFFLEFEFFVMIERPAWVRRPRTRDRDTRARPSISRRELHARRSVCPFDGDDATRDGRSRVRIRYGFIKAV